MDLQIIDLDSVWNQSDIRFVSVTSTVASFVCSCPGVALDPHVAAGRFLIDVP